MAKKPGPGKCVHCGKDFSFRTWDHVFPKGWYPDDSPKDIEKWKIPVCKACNADYGQIEEELGIVISLCLGPDAPNAKGMYKKALRAMDASKGRNNKDRIRRSKKRDKYLRMFMDGNSFPSTAVYPGFEEKWSRPKKEQTALLISEKGLKFLVEKIIKGIAYLEDDRYLDATTEIKHYVISNQSVSGIEKLLEKHGTVHSHEPGIVVVRAVAHEDGVSALYRITIWGQWVMYASVRKSSAQPVNPADP